MAILPSGTDFGPATAVAPPVARRQPPRGRTALPGPSRETAARVSAARGEAAVDAALILRFNAGDSVAFEEIVGRHREKILVLAERFLRNRADAEEIAQDTFIRAHRSLAQFRGDSSLASWLYRIALNLSRNRYWYFFRRRRHLTHSLDNTLGPETTTTYCDTIPASQADPARQATIDEFLDLLAGCMKRLNADHQNILERRNVRDEPYDEIARDLGISVGTVKSRIARARGSLRGLLATSYAALPENATSAVWFEPARSDSHAA